MTLFQHITVASRSVKIEESNAASYHGMQLLHDNVAMYISILEGCYSRMRFQGIVHLIATTSSWHWPQVITICSQRIRFTRERNSRWRNLRNWPIFGKNL